MTTDKISVRELMAFKKTDDAIEALLRLAVAAKREKEARDRVFVEPSHTNVEALRLVIAERDAALEPFTDWPEAT